MQDSILLYNKVHPTCQHCPQVYHKITCDSKIMIKGKEYYIMIEKMILTISKFIMLES
jgi:hypothetical protein